METLRDLDVVRAAAALTTLEDLNEGGDTSDKRDDDLGLMVVRFSPFNTWYEIDSFFEGQFIERTVPGAFAKTMREAGRNCKVMFNHGMDAQIDQKLLGTITDLREDTDSAVGEVRMFDTSYNRDLLPGIRSGAYGSSFMFRVIKDSWNDEPERSEHNPARLPERTIQEVRLLEFGPVTFPANPSATAGMRSVTDSYYEHIRSRDPQRYDALRARAQQLRTPPQEPAAAGLTWTSTSATTGASTFSVNTNSTAPNGAAPIENEPATPLGLSPAQRAARLRELAHPFLRRAS